MRARPFLALLIAASLVTSLSLADEARPASATAAAPNARVRVRVSSPVATHVERRATSSAPWENVCVTPCEIDGAAGEEYRVLGVDIAPSAPFALDTSKGPLLSLTVAPGSLRASRRGLWILGAGGVLGVAGIATLVVGAGIDGFGSDGVIQQQRSDVLFTGSMLVLAALGTGVWGAGTWSENHESRVNGPTLAPQRAVDVAPSSSPRAFMVPLLQGAF